MNSPLPHSWAQWRWVRDRVRRSSRAPTRQNAAQRGDFGGSLVRVHQFVDPMDVRTSLPRAGRQRRPQRVPPHAVTLCTLSQTQVTAPPAIARPSPTRQSAAWMPPRMAAWSSASRTPSLVKQRVREKGQLQSSQVALRRSLPESVLWQTGSGRQLLCQLRSGCATQHPSRPI